jgi:hypothetical protein
MHATHSAHKQGLHLASDLRSAAASSARAKPSNTLAASKHDVQAWILGVCWVCRRHHLQQLLHGPAVLHSTNRAAQLDAGYWELACALDKLAQHYKPSAANSTASCSNSVHQAPRIVCIWSLSNTIPLLLPAYSSAPNDKLASSAY